MSRLLIFLALFLCIYGTLHLYVLVKVRRAYYLQGISYILLFVLLTFLMVAPIQARILEAQDHAILALVTAWIGNLWMGFLFLFVCIALPLDGYHMMLVALQNLANTDLTHLMLSRRQSIALTTVLAFGLMTYGAYEAYHIRIEHITQYSAKIPPSAKPIRIVQLSDAHLGPMLYPGRAAQITALLAAVHPDLLVSTGDLIDGRIQNGSAVAGEFKAIATPLGKFAVTGNHEFYAGIERTTDFIRQAGFTLLRNQSLGVGKALVIAGVDDPSGGPGKGPQEAALLAGISGNKFILLLKHRPVIDPKDLGHFDLQLSGHTHQGQIFPLNLLMMLRYPFKSGFHQLKSHAGLYVSRGTGTWGPPIRLLAPPEITIIDLLPEAAKTPKTPRATPKNQSSKHKRAIKK